MLYTILMCVLTPVLLLVGAVIFRLIFFVLYYQMNKSKYKHIPPAMPDTSIPFLTLFDEVNGFEKPVDEILTAAKGNSLMDFGPMAGGEHAVLVSDPVLLRDLFDTNRFPKLALNREAFSEILGDGLVTSEGELWKRERRLISPVFHFGQLKRMAIVMSEEAQHMVDEIKAKKGPVVVGEYFSSVALRIIVRSAFGNSEHLSPDDMGPIWTRFGRQVNAFFLGHLVLGNVLGRLPFPWRQRMLNTVAEIHVRIKQAIALRRQRGVEQSGPVPNDLLGALLSAQDEDGNGIDEELIVWECTTMLFAGHDTTSNLIAWACYYLQHEPEIQQKLYDEVKQVCGDRIASHGDVHELRYTKQVLQETLRLRPPVPWLQRETPEDTTLGGVNIPKGTQLWAGIIIAHHNPQYWSEPVKKFDPDRFAPEATKARHSHAFLPFSAGSRNCVGQKFALLEAQVLLSTLIQHFHVKPSPTSPKTVMAFEGTMTPRGLEVLFEPRQ